MSKNDFLDDYRKQMKRLDKLLNPLRSKLNHYEKLIAPTRALAETHISSLNSAFETYNRIQNLMPDFNGALVNTDYSDYFEDEDEIDDVATSLDEKLVELSTKKEFSEDEKEQLVLFAEFLSDNQIQNSDDLSQKLASVSDFNIDNSQPIGDKGEHILHENGYPENEKDFLEKQNSDPTFTEIFFNKETMYRELASAIYQTIFMLIYSASKGEIDPILVLMVFNVSISIFKLRKR